MASTKFINECKSGANSNRLGKISVETIKKVSGTKLELSKTLDKKISPKLYGITKQNVYSGKNKNVRAEEVKAGSSNVANAFTNLTEYDVYKNVVEVSSSVAWMTLNTNGMSPDFYEKVKTGGFDVTTMLLIKKTNSNTTIKFYLGSITGGAVYNELKHYKDEENGWAWYYTTHTIPTSPSNTTINNHINSLATNFGTFYIAKIQTLIGNTPSDFEPYVGGQPSPNPDYPQEIEVATGSVSVKSTGKNLFNPNQEYLVSTYGYFKLPKENTKYVLSLKLKDGQTIPSDLYFGFTENGRYDSNQYIKWTIRNGGLDHSSITNVYGSKFCNYISIYPTKYNINDYFDVQLEEENKTDYEQYKESSITYNLGDNFLADKDYIENGVLNKNIRHLRLAIADMNNNDNYPGWKNVPYIGKDYPNQNNKLSNFCNYKSNITNTYVALNSLGGGSNLILFKTLFGGLTQTEIKEQYPDLILDLYYEMPQTEQIQLETTGELRTFEPNTIITNSLDSEMEVEYSSWDTEITNSDNLTDVSIEDSCYVDGQIIGTTYAKKATSQLIAIPNDVDLLDKKIKVEIGVKYADLSNEMIKMGNYTIERPKDEQTENFTQITAYDGFNLLDNPYVCNLDFSNDITIADFYIDVCNQLKLSPMKTTFLNSDIKVTANPFVNKETLRVVLQEIEKVSCTFSEIDYETNKIDLVWLSENEEPDYEFATSDYTTLEGGKITYGPVNCLVIKESQIEGENTVRQDDDSIKTNGETQIAIQDSYFLFTQALREQAIDNIWNRVKGLTYVDCKLTTSYGKPFLKVGKKIRVNVNDGRVFDTYVLKHTFKYDGTFESIIESPALTKQETKVKSKSISESIRLTEIRVDKAEGKITATTQKIQEVETDIKDNYYSKTNVNELIQTAETGVTNTFSEAGGNNILRNTGLWFESNDTDNPYEFWLGNVKKGKNDNAVGYNSMLLQNGTLEQEQEVPNGDYSISFYYQKLNQLCNASVVINDAEYPLESVEVKQFYTGEKDNETGEYIVQPIVVSSNHINIKFKCDADNGVEVYDLMCNKGSVKLAYSQNQNETTTDTVNISKGITITSSNDENVKFKADYDGIRILDGANNPKTKFTDKGMETDEAIIRYKEQTCGTLIQEVGDQTWFTRM